MGNAKNDDLTSEESKIRGRSLGGSENKDSADHASYAESRNPDTTVRVDDEEDTLYNDGLEVDDHTPPMINTDSNKTKR